MYIYYSVIASFPYHISHSIYTVLTGYILIPLKVNAFNFVCIYYVMGSCTKYPRNSAYKGASLAPRKVPQHKIYLYYRTNAVLWVICLYFIMR